MKSLKDLWFESAKQEDVNVVKFLFDSGMKINIDAEDANYWTALHWASFKGNLKVVKFLVEAGIDLYMEDLSSNNALDIAVHESHNNITEYLMAVMNTKQSKVNTCSRVDCVYRTKLVLV